MQQDNEQFCDCRLLFDGFSKGVFGEFLCHLGDFLKVCQEALADPGAWYSVPAFPAIVVREYL